MICANEPLNKFILFKSIDTESVVISKKWASDTFVANRTIFRVEKILLEAKVTKWVTALRCYGFDKVFMTDKTRELIWLDARLLVFVLVFRYFVNKLLFFLGFGFLLTRAFNQALFFWLDDGWKLWELILVIWVHLWSKISL